MFILSKNVWMFPGWFRLLGLGDWLVFGRGLGSNKRVVKGVVGGGKVVNDGGRGFLGKVMAGVVGHYGLGLMATSELL